MTGAPGVGFPGIFTVGHRLLDLRPVGADVVQGEVDDVGQDLCRDNQWPS